MTNGKTVHEFSSARFARGLRPLALSVLVWCVPALGWAQAASLNEIRIDQPSTDNDEYFEIAAAAGSTLDGLAYVVIGDGSAGSGVVEAVVDLDGELVPPGGLFVVAEDTFGLGIADRVAVLNFENSDNVTHLLVSGFRGNNGEDLDVDDDGVLDVEPWDALVDCVALRESLTGGEQTYCNVVVGPDGSFVPAHVFRCADGWQIGGFDPDSGVDTPGATNECGVPDVRINEVDYDQPGLDTGEFVEIKNTGSSAVSLGELELHLVNGSGGGSSIYRTVALPALDLAAGDYFVVCGDATRVATCDLDVSPDDNLVQNGAPDAVALVRGSLVIDVVSYEGDTAAPYTEGSGVGVVDGGGSGQDFRGISRVPDGTDTNQNNVDFVSSCITPGGPNTSVAVGCTGAGAVVEIFTIQGDGAVSPLVDQPVTTEDNVVTAVASNGFFMQTPTERSDASIDTSDGIFVFTGDPPAVTPGDRVDVSGRVAEFFGLTEITGGVVVTVVGAAGWLPAPVVFDGTTPSPDPAAPSCAVELECYEGMHVEIAAGTVTGPNQTFRSDPTAEVHVVAGGERTYREPGIAYPGLPGLPVWDGNPEVFELDPDRLGLDNLMLTAGSTFAARGVLGFEFSGYELWPVELTASPAVLPPAVRPRGPFEFTIGSLNLFRLFDDIRDGGESVVGSDEYARRLDKLATYIVGVLDAPDVLAVQEAEKLGVLEALAAAVSTRAPGVSYSAYLVEGNDIGGIDVGYLVRETVAVDGITQLGAAEILSVDGSLLHDRPPLLLAARYIAGGSSLAFEVMGLHMRSLSRIDDPVDGARVRQKRLEQAQSVAEKAQARQSANPAVPLLVVGDFNAFEFTDGYVDVVGEIAGTAVAADNLLSGPDLVEPDLSNPVVDLPETERYSFIFRGSAQVLDHVLVSETLRPRLRGLMFGRGNADAPWILLDDATTTLRASDHDGLVVYITTDSDGDGVDDAADICPGTAIPESVPSERLGFLRWALVDGDLDFDTRGPLADVLDGLFTVEQTGGCSCRQIIDRLHLGERHVRRGCSTGAMVRWLWSVHRAR